MLRLQPSEIGLTSTDIQHFKRRLDARRRARVQLLKGELSSPQPIHPRILKGPARSRDLALTRPAHPVALCYSVYDSSDDVGNGIENNAEVTSDQAEVFDNHPLQFSSGFDQEDVPEDREHECIGNSQDSRLHEVLDAKNNTADILMRPYSGIMLHGGMQPDSAQVNPTSPHQDLDRNAAFVQSMSPTHEVASDTLPQLDGLSPLLRNHAVSDKFVHEQVQNPQQRRYRPRSWSDPQELTLPALIYQRRRRPVPKPAGHIRGSSLTGSEGRSSPAVTVHSIEPESIHPWGELLAEARENKSLCESLNVAPPSHNTAAPAPAAFMALSNSPSPLEKLASATRSMYQTGTSWHQELPLRIHAGRFQPTNEPQVNERPGSPSPGMTPGIRQPSSTEDEIEESETTPRPRFPRLGHLHTYDNGKDELSVPLGASGLAGETRREFNISLSAMSSCRLEPGQGVSSNSGQGIKGSYPQRTTLCRRNAIHHSSSSFDSNESGGPNSSPNRRRRPRRVAARLHFSPRSSNEPDADRLQVTQHVLQAQQARFFRALAQANGGNLPEDAGRRWMQFLEQLASSRSENSDADSDTDVEANYLDQRRRHNESNYSSSHAPVENESDPFDLHDRPEPISPPPQRAQPFELAVARGGRPVSEATSTRRSTIPKPPLSRFARMNSEQENIDQEAWERFEAERWNRSRRAATRRHGNTSGYGADEEDNSENETPPRAGRLESFLG